MVQTSKNFKENFMKGARKKKKCYVDRHQDNNDSRFFPVNIKSSRTE